MPIKSIKSQKQIIRNECKNYRKNLDKNIKCKIDKTLCNSFLQLKEYKQSNIVFAFVPTEIEIDINKILTQCLIDNKKLALPKCLNENGEMIFYFVNSLNDLTVGMYKLLEPDTTKCEVVKDFTNGICIVPALCFDNYGYRLGFGKGYYDRFLQKFSAKTVGLCYYHSVYKNLPKGRFDKSVDILITEKYTNYF